MTRSRTAVAAVAGAAALAGAAAPGRRAASRAGGAVPGRRSSPAAPPANLPPADSPVLVRCMQLVRPPDQRDASIDQATYAYYIKTPRTDSSQGQVGALRRGQAASPTSAPVAHELPRQPVGRGHRRAVRERRRGQAHRLPHRGTVARQGRGLPAEGRHEDHGRDLQDRRQAAASRASTSRLDSFVDEATIRKVKGVIRELYSEKGYNDVTHRDSIKPMPAGRSWSHLTLQHRSGARSTSCRGRLRRQQGVQRRDAAQPDEGQQAQELVVVLHVAAAPTTKRSSPTTPTSVEEFYQNQRLRRARRSGSRRSRRSRTRRTARRAGSACACRSKRAMRYKVGTFDDHRQHGLKTEPLRAAVQVQEGDYYSLKKIQKGIEKARSSTAASAIWQWTPEPGAQAARHRSRDRQADRPRSAAADRRHHDQDERGQAVLRQPHHVHRQHDDARRRGAARDARLRGRRLQHRGAQGERPPAEPARLLQAARGQGRRDRRRRRRPARDGQVDIKLKFEEQNRNQIVVRRRRVAVRRVLRPAVVPDVELPGPRRDASACPCRRARGRGSIRCRSASRTCSIGRSRPASTCSRGSSSIPYQYTQESTGGNIGRRLPARATTRALFLGYGYEQSQRVRHQSGYLTPAVLASNPYPARLAAARSGRPPHGQQGHAERRLQHGQSADLPDAAASATRRRSTSPGLGGNTLLHQTRAARASGTSRSRSACRSACAPRGSGSAPYGTTLDAADLREVLPRRRVQRARLRHAQRSARAIRRRAS